MTAVEVDSLIGVRLDEDAALARTVELAVAHAAAGGLPFAALVLRGGVVLGGGANSTLADHDPSGRLIDAVTAVLPGIARAGKTRADPAEPFRAYLGNAR